MQGDLDSYTLITNEEYAELINPQFEGQTRLDSDGFYYMCWTTTDGKYKTKNQL